MEFGILTVSDTCYNGANVDNSGPKIKSLIESFFDNSSIVYQDLVPDEINKISEKLIEWSDNGCDVILTTGGTGISPRDVTPEATKSIIEKEIPGISYAMLNKSLTITPFAMLSRSVSGIRKKTLIINFPGSEKAVAENFMIIKDIIPHAVSLIKDDIKCVKMTHANIEKNNEDLTPSKVKIDSVATRDRKSKYIMLEVPEAIRKITTNCDQTSEIETININDALGRVLAEDVRSYEPLPPFPASIKDGYAVKSSDGAGERIVCDVKAAGDNPTAPELRDGFCVRISTGAPVPPGADAVVQVEDTELLDASEDFSQELKIDIKKAPTADQDIRKVGSDIELHTIVINKGNVLNAAEIGVLAAIGKTKVKVYNRLKIGVISTGNELQDPSEPLQPGRIRDSNKITLINVLKQYSYTAQDCGVARDDPTNVKHTLIKAFNKCDMVITTGGVSMGEFDVMKQVLIEDFNAKIHFGRVNMKPGKPTTFATCLYKGNIKTIFALPGNPVSATVTCLLFVIPALRYAENRTNIHFPIITVNPRFTPVADLERPDYQRVILNSNNSVDVSSTGNQISSKLNSFTNANGLMIVPKKSSYNGAYYSCYILNTY